MVVLKSLGAGLLAVIAVMIASLLLIPRLLRLKTGQVVSWDPTQVLREATPWLVLGIAFALGFLWEYRRLTR
jgi:hypothetical protein